MVRKSNRVEYLRHGFGRLTYLEAFIIDNHNAHKECQRRYDHSQVEHLGIPNQLLDFAVDK